MSSFVIPFLLLLQTSLANAAAGGWGSSGGDIFRDSENPWWFRNIRRVTYCIQLDTRGFSAAQAQASRAVRDALAYWKTEFRFENRWAPLPSDDQFNVSGIASQQFDEIPCNGSEDFRIQLGAGTLSPQQRLNLGDPRDHLAVAMRTHIRPRTLRSKGYIWVASDMGPEAFDLGSGRSAPQRAWSDPFTLTSVLIHELGHVFGLAHLGAATLTDPLAVMAENFPEFLLLNHPAYDEFTAKTMPRFFTPSDSFEAQALVPELRLQDGVSSAGRAYFGLDHHPDCATLAFDLIAPGQISVSCFNLERDQTATLGTIRFSNVQYRANPVIRTYLDSKQKVFEPIEAALLNGTGASAILDFQIQGAEYITTGEAPDPRAIYLEVTPRSLQVLGVVDQRIETLAIGYYRPAKM